MKNYTLKGFVFVTKRFIIKIPETITKYFPVKNQWRWIVSHKKIGKDNDK